MVRLTSQVWRALFWQRESIATPPPHLIKTPVPVLTPRALVPSLGAELCSAQAQGKERRLGVARSRHRIVSPSHPSIHPFHLLLSHYSTLHPHYPQTHTPLIPPPSTSTPLPSMSGEIRRKLVIVGECGSIPDTSQLARRRWDNRLIPSTRLQRNAC
jgi:hypothetical protein